MNELGKIFKKNRSDKSDSKHNYHTIYHKHLKDIRKDEINLLEIGVAYGGSLKSWLEYLPNANIFGMDNFANNKEIEESVLKDLSKYKRLEIINESQISDVALDKLSKKEFDIIIDDASHVSEDQQYTFSKLANSVKNGGLYFIEDLHCIRNSNPNFKIKAENTIDVLKTFYKDKKYESLISSEKENDFITNNFSVIEIYKDSICVLKKYEI